MRKMAVYIFFLVGGVAAPKDGTPEAPKKVAPKTTEISILDGKRSYNIGALFSE